MAMGMIYMGFNGMIFDGMGLSGDGYGSTLLGVYGAMGMGLRDKGLWG